MKTFARQDVPTGPGVYVFRNSSGTVIYVGKAKALRKRLATYFRPSGGRRADPKLRALINSISSYEVFSVQSETEALLLESRFIKEYVPRYNVELRDDKRFLHISIDMQEPFPRLQLTRLRKEDGRLYFGPFPQAGVLRETVAVLSKRFGLRTCRRRRPDADARRHCLQRKVSACSCPCAGAVDAAEYASRLEQAIAVLKGSIRDVVAELEQEMAAAAQARRFEDAAQRRDLIANLRSVCDPRRRSFARATMGTAKATPASAGESLQADLGLSREPRLIHCFDLSNIGGTFAVGSMVCFRGGRADKKAYRRFRIRSQQARDDTAMMREVVQRQYQRSLAEGRELPDLIVVDGGRGQLQAAVAGLRAAASPPLPLLALAKRQEEIYLPGRPDPVVLPRHHTGLQLLQAVRDEAHRFALGYHRRLRRQRIAESLLAEIDGVGPKRQAALLKAFGSVRRLRDTAPSQVAATVAGIGSDLAQRIQDYLRTHTAARRNS